MKDARETYGMNLALKRLYVVFGQIRVTQLRDAGKVTNSASECVQEHSASRTHNVQGTWSRVIKRGEVVLVKEKLWEGARIS